MNNNLYFAGMLAVLHLFGAGLVNVYAQSPAPPDSAVIQNLEQRVRTLEAELKIAATNGSNSQVALTARNFPIFVGLLESDEMRLSNLDCLKPNQPRPIIRTPTCSSSMCAPTSLIDALSKPHINAIYRDNGLGK